MPGHSLITFRCPATVTCCDALLQVEVGEKKDRVTDALNATKAAVEEGIVPGRLSHRVTTCMQNLFHIASHLASGWALLWRLVYRADQPVHGPLA